MKALTAVIIATMIITGTVTLVRVSSAATKAFAANSPKTTEKEKVMDEVNQAFSSMGVFQQNGSLVIDEECERFHQSLLGIEKALQDKVVTELDILSAPCAEKAWFRSTLESLKSGENNGFTWKSLFWIAHEISQAKLAWEKTKKGVADGNQDDIEKCLRQITLIQNVLEKGKPELSRNKIGSYGWLEDHIAREKGIFMRGFPSYREIKAMREKLEKKIKDTPAIVPPKKKQNERGMRPFKIEELALYDMGLKVSF